MNVTAIMGEEFERNCLFQSTGSHSDDPHLMTPLCCLTNADVQTFLLPPLPNAETDESYSGGSARPSPASA